MTAGMTLYQHSGSAFVRYGALPSVCDSTALDEITLYGDLLQAVADAASDSKEGTAGRRLTWDVIDRALGVIPATKMAGKAAAMPGTRRPTAAAPESAQ